MNPYLRLCRLHRPAAILLILLPCWWGVTLAASFTPSPAWRWDLLALFAVGATVMRGAGCTLNDLVDQDIDRRVSRTKGRPLAAGELSSSQAMIFFALQCLAGLGIVVALPPRCWPLSGVGLTLLGVYPFMKRVTHWPQLVLGLAFNLGVMFGVVAVLPWEAVPWPAVLGLYGAGIAWTLGYDTLYALQDKEDDLKIGVKSTTIYFGDQVKPALAGAYGLMFVLLLGVGYSAGGDIFYYSLLATGALGTAACLFFLRVREPADCLKAFKANAYLGGIVWGALLTLRG